MLHDYCTQKHAISISVLKHFSLLAIGKPAKAKMGPQATRQRIVRLELLSTCVLPDTWERLPDRKLPRQIYQDSSCSQHICVVLIKWEAPYVVQSLSFRSSVLLAIVCRSSELREPPKEAMDEFAGVCNGMTTWRPRRRS